MVLINKRKGLGKKNRTRSLPVAVKPAISFSPDCQDARKPRNGRKFFDKRFLVVIQKIRPQLHHVDMLAVFFYKLQIFVYGLAGQSQTD